MRDGRALVGRAYPLEAINEAFATMKAGGAALIAPPGDLW
jgi:Zn-dependent alcohol dehydrogenase